MPAGLSADAESITIFFFSSTSSWPICVTAAAAPLSSLAELEKSSYLFHIVVNEANSVPEHYTQETTRTIRNGMN